MTVKELKKKLDMIPDDFLVIGYYTFSDNSAYLETDDILIGRYEKDANGGDGDFIEEEKGANAVWI